MKAGSAPPLKTPPKAALKAALKKRASVKRAPVVGALKKGSPGKRALEEAVGALEENDNVRHECT
jgi:hypothetical protein